MRKLAGSSILLLFPSALHPPPLQKSIEQATKVLQEGAVADKGMFSKENIQ
jgi:hypothetical protein